MENQVNRGLDWRIPKIHKEVQGLPMLGEFCMPKQLSMQNLLQGGDGKIGILFVQTLTVRVSPL